MTCISNTSVKLIKIGNQDFFFFNAAFLQTGQHTFIHASAGVCVYVHACVWMGGGGRGQCCCFQFPGLFIMARP